MTDTPTSPEATPMTGDDVTPPASTAFEPAEPLKTSGVSFESADEGMTGSTADKAKDRAADAAGQAADEAKMSAASLKQQAGDKAREFADQGKSRATDALGQLAQMLTDAAGNVDDKLGEQYGQYARSAADTVSGYADQLNAKDVDALLDDVRGLVRRSPGVAVGAAAAVGFVVARLLTAGFDQRDA